jgi:LETM1 and EF-hand domain-containing protein 1
LAEAKQNIKPTEEARAANNPVTREAASLAEMKNARDFGADATEKKAVEEKKDSKKLTIGQKIKKEAQHYWDGTKLLATEVKISTKLALKMAAGYELSRRENRQVKSLPEFVCSCRDVYC